MCSQSWLFARFAALTLLCSVVGCGRTDPLTPRTNPNDRRNGPIPDECVVEVTPEEIDFGAVPLGTQVAELLELRNVGEARCDVARLVIGEGSDPEFSLLFPPVTPFALLPGEVKHVQVAFEARSHDLPRDRTGTAVVVSTSAGSLQFVPLRARILVGCDLQVQPATMDFGSVPLNKAVMASVSLVNVGDAPCQVSNLALAAGSDHLFSIPSDQPSTFIVGPGGVPLRGAFSARDSAEPHERFGTMTFTRSQPTGLPATPTEDLQVPMQATIDTACFERSQWIYTIDDTGRLAKFDPEHLAYTDIGTLNCPTMATPFSMAVDQNAVAWVEFIDGQLYRVDTSNAQCAATTYTGDPNVTNFGMGFSYDPDTGKDTLFIAGGGFYGDIPSTLATISFPSLSVSTVAQLDFGAPELTGTGDGQLWGFAPSFNSASHVTTLARIDPKSGQVLASMQYPEIFEGAASYALGFWGGSFWLFLGETIYEVPRDTLQSQVALSYTGRNVVGVGVSTCAPLE